MPFSQKTYQNNQEGKAEARPNAAPLQGRTTKGKQVMKREYHWTTMVARCQCYLMTRVVVVKIKDICLQETCIRDGKSALV
jgi:hypothetical protein